MMILYGAGDHAKVIFECLMAVGEEVSLVFDDDQSKKHLNNMKVQGAYNPSLRQEDSLIIAIGNNKIRKQISKKVSHRYGSVIHPSVLFSPYAKLGTGSVIIHAAVIQAGVTIKDHCIINTGAIIEHEAVIEDYVHIASKVLLSGNVSVGEGTLVGAGSTIIPGVSVGKWCVIGAGTVVIKDVPDYSLVVGNPGRIVRSLEIEEDNKE